jgi:hypothetical protein
MKKLTELQKLMLIKAVMYFVMAAMIIYFDVNIILLMQPSAWLLSSVAIMIMGIGIALDGIKALKKVKV